MIDEEKRIKLNKKREQLLLKKAEEERYSLINDLISHLDNKSTKYEVILDSSNDDCLSARVWAYNSFNFLSWGRIDQKDDNFVDVVAVENFDSCDLAVKGLINNHTTEAKYVYIFWTNANRPILKIKFDDFITHAYEIFEEDWDTWVVAPDENWGIEYHHDGELSLFKARSAS